MIEIIPQPILDQTVRVPGSKSYTHRALITSALSSGTCLLTGGLDSQDTRLTRLGLSRLGVRMESESERWIVHGSAGRLSPWPEPIDLHNSGTSMRLLTAVCALGRGKYRLTGSPRMQERPVENLLDGLQGMGVHAVSVGKSGCPPVEIHGGPVLGGRIKLDCGVSSQFLSAILLIGPYTKQGVEIEITRGPVSKPYIDITLGVMADFGIPVKREEYRWFHVPGGRTYSSRAYRIEPDASQAGYFWAAAAVTGAGVTVDGIDLDSRQGDVRFVDVLSQMGCRVERKTGGIRVTGGDLRAVEVDMGNMPDLVPTLAVTAAFARGTTRIRNVAHLRVKESDRLSVTASELRKMGIVVNCHESGMDITGGIPHGADIDPHDDHRIAMSFAVAGLVTPGVRIREERCVEKSFPDFWKVFGSLGEPRVLRGPFPD